MDVLSDVLRVIRLSGAVFFVAEFSSRWAIESPPSESLAPFIMPRAECFTPVIHGRGGEVARLVCGYLYCDQKFNPLFSGGRKEPYWPVETTSTAAASFCCAAENA